MWGARVWAKFKLERAEETVLRLEMARYHGRADSDPASFVLDVKGSNKAAALETRMTCQVLGRVIALVV